MWPWIRTVLSDPHYHCVLLQVEWGDHANHQGVLLADGEHVLLRGGGEDDGRTAGGIPGRYQG